MRLVKLGNKKHILVNRLTFCGLETTSGDRFKAIEGTMDCNTCKDCLNKANSSGKIMNEYRERIKKHLDSWFEPGSIVKYEDFPWLPGGVRVFDKTGKEAVFYFDLLNGKLYCTSPGDKKPYLCANPGEW